MRGWKGISMGVMLVLAGMLVCPASARAMVVQEGATGARKPGVAKDQKQRVPDRKIVAALKKYIDNQVRQGGGWFRFRDPRTGKTKKLKFVRLHNRIRRDARRGVATVCADFKEAGDAQQVYDIDFQVRMKDGRIDRITTRIHKAPRPRREQKPKKT